MLKLHNIRVSHTDEIVHGISLQVSKGELVVIMGPNGSGKSSFAQAIMGNPSYKLDAESHILCDGKDITSYEPHEKARAGLFLGFQTPIAIPGVSVVKLLREVTNVSFEEIRRVAKELGCSDSLLVRGVNDGFSGGERKKIEMLQAHFLAKNYAFFDEIDTGVDIDALKIIANSLTSLVKRGVGCIVITHSLRLIDLLPVDRILVMREGIIKKEGKKDLARTIEHYGYEKF